MQSYTQLIFLRARSARASISSDDKDDGIIIISMPKALLRQQSRYALRKVKNFPLCLMLPPPNPGGGGRRVCERAPYFGKLLLHVQRDVIKRLLARFD